MLLICISTYSIKAEYIENTNTYTNSFKTVVYNSDTYAKYKDDIESIYVDRSVITDEGLRFTLSFLLHQNNGYSMQLTYVGDEYGNILENVLMVDNDNSLSLIDLKKNIKTSVNYKERGVAHICFKKVCSSYTHKLNAHKELPRCSSLVGQGCTDYSILGHPVAAIICKSGVWIACHYSIDKVCNNFTEYLDVCAF